MKVSEAKEKDCPFNITHGTWYGEHFSTPEKCTTEECMAWEKTSIDGDEKEGYCKRLDTK